MSTVSVSSNFSNCKDNILSKLPQATGFIKDWLNNPITKNKIKKLNKISDERLSQIYKTYYHILDNIDIVIFSDPKINTIAFVQGINPLRVNMNCHYISNEDVVDTLIHEIQHLLWYQYPMNPQKLIGESFLKPGQTPKNLNNLLDTTKEEFEGLRKQLINYGIPQDKTNPIINQWIKFYKSLSPDHRKYACNENEKMSNIMQLRRFFKLQPGEDITVEMILPYITFKKKLFTDLSWVLLCWALNGFNDITKMLNSFNELATGNSEDNTTFV
jgi:hypothetical protein